MQAQFKTCNSVMLSCSSGLGVGKHVALVGGGAVLSEQTKDPVYVSMEWPINLHAAVVINSCLIDRTVAVGTFDKYMKICR